LSTVAFFTLSGVGNAAELPPNCERAKTLLAAGDANAAESEYRKLLGNELCAEQGFADAHAKVANEAADAKAAKKTADEQAPKAQIALAERLQDAGFQKEARGIVKAVVEKSKKKVSIPARLRVPDQPTAGWRALIADVAPDVLSGAEAIAVVLGTLAAVFALFSITRALKRRHSPVVRLTGFGGSTDTTLGAALSSTLSATLRSMSDSDASSRVYGVGATEPKFTLPEAVTDAVPQAGLIAGLLQVLDQLLPRKLNFLSGTVHGAQAGRGAGLTLAIANRSGKPLEQETFWEQDYLIGPGASAESAVARYERLVRPAAIWLAYRETIGYDPAKPPLGTDDWRSYARFAVGEASQDPVLKRRLFEIALDRDAENLGARLNLAAALIQRPAGYVEPVKQPPSTPWRERQYPARWEDNLKQAQRHLDWIRKHIAPATNPATNPATHPAGKPVANAEPTADPLNPLWYRAQMLLIVLNITQEKGAAAGPRLDVLSAAIKKHRNRPELSDLLGAMAPAAGVLKHTATLLEKKKVPAEVETSDREWLTALAQYNLACFWSRAIKNDRKVKKADALKRSIRALRRALEREPWMLSAARGDAAFDPIRATDAFQTLLASIEDAQPKPAAADPPTRYTITVDPGSELTELIKTYA